jgi:hypothetical protein
LEEFFAGDSAGLTVIYVHGNRIESCEARQTGRRFYRTLTRCVSDPTPIRCVIWSWPSGQIRGQIRDVRCKAQRSNWEGVYLAWFLSRIDQQASVSLVGHSFGARVITGALHMLAGGAIAGQRLPAERSPRATCRVVLLAAALHNHWLSPGAFHGRAPDQMDRLLLLYNSCDPALRRYHLVEKCGSPEALGYTGLWNLAAFESAAQRVQQWDACGTVGKSHGAHQYLCSPQLMEQVRRCALWRSTDG